MRRGMPRRDSSTASRLHLAHMIRPDHIEQIADGARLDRVGRITGDDGTGYRVAGGGHGELAKPLGQCHAAHQGVDPAHLIPLPGRTLTDNGAIEPLLRPMHEPQNDYRRECQFRPGAATRHDDPRVVGHARAQHAVPAIGLGVLVIAATAYGQIRLNSWNKPFYDALSHRDFAQFLEQLGIFGLLAGALLVLNVAQRWLTETLKLKMRQGLATDLIHNWMLPGRAFGLPTPAPSG